MICRGFIRHLQKSTPYSSPVIVLQLLRLEQRRQIPIGLEHAAPPVVGHVVSLLPRSAASGFRTARRCRLVWRESDFVGAEFVDRQHLDKPQCRYQLASGGDYRLVYAKTPLVA
jgi:hypothetical protein